MDQKGIPEPVTLAKLAEIALDRELGAAPCSHFVSPVSKETCFALPVDNLAAVHFLPTGGLDQTAELVKALQEWLGRPEDEQGALVSWLRDAHFDDALLGVLVQWIDNHRVNEHRLVSSRVCRLLRRDQVRYDSANRIVYHLTPAEQTAMRDTCGPLAGSAGRKELERLTSLQNTFWSLPTSLQSLIAMYDSDLGKEDEPEGHSKRFLSVESGGKSYTPHELNTYSAFRYWALPHVFAHTVFPMLIWKPILTGEDLYHRPVPGETPAERASYYLVAVNTFNSASFRAADYGELLKQIWHMAKELQEYEGSRSMLPPNAVLLEAESILTTLASRRLADESGQGKAGKAAFIATGHRLAMKLDPLKTHDLFAPYQQGQPLKRAHVLRFLRDKCLELLTWSYSQAEIRSAGTVPIEVLYRVRFVEDRFDKQVLETFAPLSEAVRAKHDAMVQLRDLDERLQALEAKKEKGLEAKKQRALMVKKKELEAEKEDVLQAKKKALEAIPVLQPACEKAFDPSVFDRTHGCFEFEQVFGGSRTRPVFATSALFAANAGQ